MLAPHFPFQGIAVRALGDQRYQIAMHDWHEISFALFQSIVASRAPWLPPPNSTQTRASTVGTLSGAGGLRWV
jgi:hypothetical protein